MRKQPGTYPIDYGYKNGYIKKNKKNITKALNNGLGVKLFLRQ